MNSLVSAYEKKKASSFLMKNRFTHDYPCKLFAVISIPILQVSFIFIQRTSFYCKMKHVIDKKNRSYLSSLNPIRLF